MIIKRPFWQELIEKMWQERNIIWLMGVRRVGKTSLCKSLSNIEYFDCEMPRIRQMLEDPESFLQNFKGKRIVLDEIHRLNNPSEILKIAADHYSEVKIIATGSSTLGASKKFKDTLTGRKREIWLTPLLLEENENFGNFALSHRFLFGGLPSFFVAKNLPERDFNEWVDAFWAKDIQDMFSVGKKHSFQKFTELLLAQSGGIFESSKFAIPCEVSRQTISHYLAILEETFVAHVIRPYSTHKATEIVAAPKVYSFDTGFTCYAKDWKEIRNEDRGLLWEQCVLNELHAKLQTKKINYWRDKRGHEIDFVISHKTNTSVTVIECKFSTINIDFSSFSKNIGVFRKLYPEGRNFIVASDVTIPFARKIDEILLEFVSPEMLIKALL